MKRILSAVALTFALSVVFAAQPALAQACDPKKDPTCCDPKTQKCDTTAACSPGYYRNHQDTWCNVLCPTGIIIADCQPLLDALFSTGTGSGTKKNAASNYINETCFVTAEASPCTDD
jgi:hypothetical protein